MDRASVKLNPILYLQTQMVFQMAIKLLNLLPIVKLYLKVMAAWKGTMSIVVKGT